MRILRCALVILCTLLSCPGCSAADDSAGTGVEILVSGKTAQYASLVILPPQE